MRRDETSQVAAYQSAVREFGPALSRLASAYEFNEETRRDLLQDIHLALWRSLAIFDHRCSLRTWVFRIAHNTATSHVSRSRRRQDERQVDLDELASLPANDNPEQEAGDRWALKRLLSIIHRLQPPDKQIMLLYLEDLDTETISEIIGLSSSSVSSRIHRAKAVLAKHFQNGG